MACALLAPCKGACGCRYKEEQRQGSFLFPGSFGTPASQTLRPSLPTAVPKVPPPPTASALWGRDHLGCTCATPDPGQPYALACCLAKRLTAAASAAERGQHKRGALGRGSAGHVRGRAAARAGPAHAADAGTQQPAGGAARGRAPPDALGHAGRPAGCAPAVHRGAYCAGSLQDGSSCGGVPAGLLSSVLGWPASLACLARLPSRAGGLCLPKHARTPAGRSLSQRPRLRHTHHLRWAEHRACAGWLLRQAASARAVAHRLQLGGDALCSHTHTDEATGHTTFLRYRLKLQAPDRQRGRSQVGALPWPDALLGPGGLTSWVLACKQPCAGQAA